MWEGVGDRTGLQHIDPHSYGHNSVTFPFSWAAQPGAWGPASLGAGFLYRILSPTDWTSCALSYKIVRRPPSSCGRHKSHSFNLSTVMVIFWCPSTGCTCYLHRCISYFDSSAGSEVNIQHNHIPTYINANSNYPRSIIKQIPKTVNLKIGYPLPKNLWKLWRNS